VDVAAAAAFWKYNALTALVVHRLSMHPLRAFSLSQQQQLRSMRAALTLQMAADRSCCYFLLLLLLADPAAAGVSLSPQDRGRRAS
jgi:hypothetical protein